MLSSGRFFLQKNSETSSVLTDEFLFWEVRRMKIIMITGFLGSGKTTLMQNILCEYGKSMKAGVIVNDFGKENIDAKLLGEEGIALSELSNGSIFCACIKDKFVDSLIEMSHRDLEYLFIEASGLADPSNMGTILEGIKNETGGSLQMQGSVCITDAQTFLNIYNLLPAVERQITHADIVIVNKRSMVGAETIEKIHEIIKEKNTEAAIYDTDFCKVDMQHAIFELTNHKKEAEETTNAVSNRALTLVVKGDTPVQPEVLEDLLRSVMPSAYRIKGFAQTTEGCMSVSCTMKNFNMNPWKEAEPTSIVFVSAVGIQLISLVSGWLQEHKETGLRIG